MMPKLEKLTTYLCIDCRCNKGSFPTICFGKLDPND